MGLLELRKLAKLEKYLTKAVNMHLNLDAGLCYIVLRDLGEDHGITVVKFMRKCFESWPETSGNVAYPIEIKGYSMWELADQFDAVHSESTGRTESDNGFILADFQGAAEYRAARIRLAEYIISEIEKEFAL
jgi:hypothetical protein